jgi:hypothetical protein
VATAQTIVLTNRQAEVQIQLREVQAGVALVMALGGGWDSSHLPARKDLTAHQGKWTPASASAAPTSEPVAPANQ